MTHGNQCMAHASVVHTRKTCMHDDSAESEKSKQAPLPRPSATLYDQYNRPLFKQNMEFKYGPCATRESHERCNNAAMEARGRGAHQGYSGLVIPDIKTAAAARQLPGTRQLEQLTDHVESGAAHTQAPQTVPEYVTPAPAVTRQLFVNFGAFHIITPLFNVRHMYTNVMKE